LIDADDIVLDYSGLANISPLDFRGTAEYFAKQIDAMPTVDAIPISYIQKEIEDLEKSLDFYGSIGEYDALRIDAMYQHDALTGLLRQWKAERKDNG